MPTESGGVGGLVRQERAVCRFEGLALHLAPQQDHLVAKGQQFDLFGTIGAGEEDYELEQVADGEVAKRPIFGLVLGAGAPRGT